MSGPSLSAFNSNEIIVQNTQKLKSKVHKNKKIEKEKKEFILFNKKQNES